MELTWRTSMAEANRNARGGLNSSSVHFSDHGRQLLIFSSIQLCPVKARCVCSRSALCSHSMRHCAPAQSFGASITKKTKSNGAKRWRPQSERGSYEQGTNNSFE